MGRGKEKTNSLMQRRWRRKYIVEKKKRGEAENMSLAPISFFM